MHEKSVGGAVIASQPDTTTVRGLLDRESNVEPVVVVFSCADLPQHYAAR